MQKISIHAPRTGSDVGADVLFHPAFRISIHAPRTGSDAAQQLHRLFFIQFQSTLPARGATLRETLIDGGVIKFQSTLPARGATILIGLLSSAWYFNPRSPHGERLASDADVRHFAHISIHAPRTGSDRRVAYTINRQTGISIHAPHTGSDNLRVAREAVERHDFNPRSPHGERRAPPMTSVSPPSVFQSTLPARGATDASHSSMRRFRFQSTLPARGATGARLDSAEVVGISIHAPRTGSDVFGVGHTCRHGVFQSTLPARGATCIFPALCLHFPFQSTLPARGATLFRALRRAHIVISIHAPRTGSDVPPAGRAGIVNHISIHAPRTGSDPNAPAKLPTAPISIHAPRTGSDARRLFGFAAAAISIHAPRTGSDQGYRRAWRRVQANFNPRSPHGERLRRNCLR